jgi:hypothetical protein
VLLSRWTQFKVHSIWAPRWHDKVVLIAKFRVGEHNKIVFTKDKTMGTKPYYVSGAVIKKCKLEDNGEIKCYAVPIDKLEPLELTDKDMRILI